MSVITCCCCHRNRRDGYVKVTEGNVIIYLLLFFEDLSTCPAKNQAGGGTS